MRRIIIEHNIRTLDGKTTGEKPIIQDNDKDGYMCAIDFSNLTRWYSMDEPRTDEFKGRCPKTKQDVIYNRTLIITEKTDKQLINEYKEENK